MNTKRIKEVFKSSSYVIFSNLLILTTSVIVILILPKLIGVEEYGHWQLYLLYISYVGFFHFGWIDGIYLRYGGEYYHNLNKNRLFSQFLLISLLQIFIASIFCIVAGYYVHADKRIIFVAVAIGLITTNLKLFFVYILQATNRIKESAILQSGDRLFLLLFFITFFLNNYVSYQSIIWADVLARIITLIGAFYFCKDIVFLRLPRFRFEIEETVLNIKSGIGLMFSNVASMLIVGSVRFAIEFKWGVALFGKVSLILSISNLFLVFVNAFGIVFFPLLRRMEPQNIKMTFVKVRSILVPILLSALLLYYPLRWFLSVWLPEYKESIEYMLILFPMVIFESKMALLNNTFMKVLRLEFQMLRLNVIALLVSLLGVIVNVLYFQRIDWLIGSITTLLWLRCFMFDLYIARVLGVKINLGLIFEIMAILSFILLNLFMPWQEALCGYLAVLVVYMLLNNMVCKNKCSDVEE